MSGAKRKTILAIVATDNTFERAAVDDDELWQGKCIFCRRKLLIAVDGTPISEATIEHILPRNHGGDDSLTNLALACANCNHEKGRRHDNKPKSDKRRQQVTDNLRAERDKRWRDPS